MSMLAERRTKVSYILNPRKTMWDAEENNFGKKLMEKMGWAAGKGLGKTEQGLTESIKVKYKNDSKGMGYAGPPDCPVKLQDEFSQLLADLNDSPDVAALPTVNQVTSLEKRSESSRSRVHYRKFTRGKDLSRYSEKDLACIIGPEALGEKKKSKKKIEEEEEIKEEKSKFGVPTTNGGLMGDYFKVKLKAKGLDIDEIERKRKEEKVETKRTNKKLLSQYQDILEKDDSEYNPLALFKKSVKQISQEEEVEDPIENNEEEEVEDPIENNEEEEEPVRKKKKKEKELVNFEEDNEEEEPARKKKKKEKELANFEVENTEEPPRQKKKKKLKELEIELPVKVKKSKKNKNKKFQEELVEEEEEVVEIVPKSKKSKHKKHKNKK